MTKKRQNLIVLVIVGFIAALVSIVISGAIFGTPQSHPIKVPVVEPISPTFPDVQHDSNYTTFLNSNALDPTQLIQIGNSNNSTPFQGGSTSF
jgi:energy-converting hydrogenase Eha subunit A